jgi:peptide deformylase
VTDPPQKLIKPIRMPLEQEQEKTIYPIVAYGSLVLKKRAKEIARDYEGLDILIRDMFATLEATQGVGLAAPQINKSIRLFITDGKGYAKEEPSLANFRKVFINPVLLEEKGEMWNFNEGCLSIPGIREDIERTQVLRIRYVDEEWKEQEEEYSGIAARIIQHEYDHLEGVLFTDRLTAFKKRLLKGKLTDISKGIVDVDYKMKFPVR